MERVNRCMIWVEKILALLILIGILGTMFAQVVARYIFRTPFSWSEELCRLGLIWLTFLAAAYIMAQRRHLAVDLWSSRVPPVWKTRADLFVLGVVAMTCLLLCLGSLRFVWYVHPVGSPALGLAKSYWYAGVSVGLLLMAFHALVQAWATWIGEVPEIEPTSEADEKLQLNWSADSPITSPRGSL
jgi:TRAP-type C4-dicarboxylate transport system permease small subunit